MGFVDDDDDDDDDVERDNMVMVMIIIVNVMSTEAVVGVREPSTWRFHISNSSERSRGLKSEGLDSSTHVIVCDCL